MPFAIGSIAFEVLSTERLPLFEPSPADPELFLSTSGSFRDELLDTAKIALYRILHVGLRQFWLKALPGEVVTPHLTGVTEDLRFGCARSSEGRAYDLLKRRINKLGTFDGLFNVSTWVR